MLEATYVEPNDRYEIIEGVKYMSATPVFGHNFVAGRLFLAFNNYFEEQPRGVAVYEIDVRLPDGNNFRPDVCVICDFGIINDKGKIHGAPDIVIEVLSPSTAKRDLTMKMKIYERNDIKEYWIIDWVAKNIFVYKLVNGSYELDDVYHDYANSELDQLEADERAEVKTEIEVPMFPGLRINVHNIFKWWSIV